MVGIVLDEWQKEFMEHKGHSLCCTGRRVGKTYIHSRKAVKRMLEKPGTKIIVASLTEDQAKLIIIFALDFLEKNYPKKVKKNQRFTNQSKITLTNGSSMTARPVGTTGDSIRGFEGDVLILDEVSRFSQLILDAATPVLLTTGGEIWMCSTPWGKQGYFWDCFKRDKDNPNGRFKVFAISSEEVIYNRPINMFWTEKKREAAIAFLEQEKADKSEMAYAQEYLGEFVDSFKTFYTEDLINKACCLKKDNIAPIDNNYMGCDIGRMGGDATTYEIFNAPREPGKKIKQVAHFQEQYKLTTHTEKRIIELTKQFSCEKVGIDAGSGSLGVGVYDHLLEHPETTKKVVAMNNRQISLDRYGNRTQRIMNEDYHDNLRSMMEHGELLLLDDEEIKNSFRSILIERNLEEDKPTKIRIWGRNSHIVEGIKRAAWLAKKEKSKNIQILSF